MSFFITLGIFHVFFKMIFKYKYIKKRNSYKYILFYIHPLFTSPLYTRCLHSSLMLSQSISMTNFNSSVMREIHNKLTVQNGIKTRHMILWLFAHTALHRLSWTKHSFRVFNLEQNRNRVNEILLSQSMKCVINLSSKLLIAEFNIN